MLTTSDSHDLSGTNMNLWNLMKLSCCNMLQPSVAPLTFALSPQQPCQWRNASSFARALSWQGSLFGRAGSAAYHFSRAALKSLNVFRCFSASYHFGVNLEYVSALSPAQVLVAGINSSPKCRVNWDPRDRICPTRPCSLPYWSIDSYLFNISHYFPIVSPIYSSWFIHSKPLPAGAHEPLSALAVRDGCATPMPLWSSTRYLHPLSKSTHCDNMWQYCRPPTIFLFLMIFSVWPSNFGGCLSQPHPLGRALFEVSFDLPREETTMTQADGGGNKPAANELSSDSSGKPTLELSPFCCLTG
jgi:hypothetical protein